MRKYKMLLLSVLMTIFIFSVLSGCGKSDNKNIYKIYYVDPAHSDFVTRNYKTESEDVTKLIKELYDEMRKSPNENSVSVIPDNIILNAYYIENNVLNMDFSLSYMDMNNIDKVLFKTAIVKTFAQLPSIEYVYFHIMGQPVAGENDMGLIGNNSIITENEVFDDSINNISTVLYFSDNTGEKLVGESREIKYNQNSSVESLIVENLIKGPNDSGNKRTLPPKLKVLSVSTKDGVCYVNFDSEILSSIADVSGKVTIYSVVNSLCELPSVKRVQFLVNGSNNYTLRETYSFKDTYERNLDIIKKE